jgi:hypothetical protein
MRVVLLLVLLMLCSACTSSNTKQPAGSASVNQELSDEDRERVDEHIASAHAYAAEEHYGLALVELDQALTISPDHDQAFTVRAEVRRAATAVVEAESARAAQDRQAQTASYASTPPKGTWLIAAQGMQIGIAVADYRTQFGVMTAPRGSRFVLFSMVVQNIGSGTVHVNPTLATLVDQRGGSHSLDAATFVCPTPLNAVDVRPGNSASGCLVFQIPENTGPAKLIYNPMTLFGSDIVVDFEREPDRP